MPDPNEIIPARRKPGTGTVTAYLADGTARELHEGDVIPMRREEAEQREDFSPVEEEPPASNTVSAEAAPDQGAPTEAAEPESQAAPAETPISDATLSA